MEEYIENLTRTEVIIINSKKCNTRKFDPEHFSNELQPFSSASTRDEIPEYSETRMILYKKINKNIQNKDYNHEESKTVIILTAKPRNSFETLSHEVHKLVSLMGLSALYCRLSFYT